MFDSVLGHSVHQRWAATQNDCVPWTKIFVSKINRPSALSAYPNQGEYLHTEQETDWVEPTAETYIAAESVNETAGLMGYVGSDLGHLCISVSISRPTDATCDKFLFSIYMCITLHVSSVKRSSSGVPHRTYSLLFLELILRFKWVLNINTINC
jgi:hypothetical protein